MQHCSSPVCDSEMEVRLPELPRHTERHKKIHCTLQQGHCYDAIGMEKLSLRSGLSLDVGHESVYTGSESLIVDA